MPLITSNPVNKSWTTPRAGRIEPKLLGPRSHGSPVKLEHIVSSTHPSAPGRPSLTPILFFLASTISLTCLFIWSNPP